MVCSRITLILTSHAGLIPLFIFLLFDQLQEIEVLPS